MQPTFIFPSIRTSRTKSRHFRTGRKKILFAALPAQFQVTISYLYFPPIVFGQINAPIYCDEGSARQINVLPQPQRPRWVLAILWGLIVIGVIAVVYALFELVRRAAS
jgi:hypothetical protein